MKKLLVSICALLICSAVLVGLTSEISAEKSINTDVNLKDSYVVGEEFILPEYSQQINNETIKGQPLLIFPNGRANKNKVQVLDSAGQYILKYNFIKNSKLIKEVEFKFDVYQSLFEIKGEGSINYASNILNKEGLSVSLNSGSELVLNQTINLRKINDSESLLSLFVNPLKAGTSDFNKLYITLTDIYDSNNYLKICVQASAAGNLDKIHSYVLAGGTGQPLSGYEQGFDNIHRDSSWGTPIEFSFWGVNFENNLLTLKYNHQTKEVYCNNSRVIDLDNIKEFSTIWNGFSTDEVKVSVMPSGYTSSSANFVLTKIAGIDLTKSVADERQDTIFNIDTKEYSELPKGIVNTYYPVFSATATNNGHTIKVTKRVFLNYSNRLFKTEIDISNDKFLPQKKGIYTIEYSAVDVFGNKNIKTVDVTVDTQQKKLAVSASYSGRITKGYVGEKIYLPEMIVSGGVGKIVGNIKALIGVQTIICKDGYFRPDRAGIYSVVYDAEDFLGQRDTYVFNIDVSYSDKPVFLGDIEIPEYYLAGYRYKVPEVNAYYISASEEISVKATAELVLNGEKLVIDNSGYVYINNLENNSILHLTYTAGGSEVSFDVPVIKTTNNNNLDLSRFFIAKDDNVLVSAMDTSIEIAAHNDATIKYARPIVAGTLDLRFNAMPEVSGYKYLRLIITDSLDINQKIAIDFYDKTSETLVKINNKDAVYVNAVMYRIGRNDFTVQYANNSILVNSKLAKINDYYDGKAFSGFDSGLVYIEFKFCGVDSESGIAIKSINNQAMSARVTKDNLKPNISLMTNDFGGIFKLDSIVRTEIAVAADVISSQIDFDVMVNDPDGNVVLDKSNPNIQHEIKLNKYGSYVVTYTATDLTNNKTEYYTYVYLVEYVNKPNIEVEKLEKAQYKLGEIVIIPECKVTVDNAEIKTLRYLITTKNKMIELEDDVKSFKAEALGTYQLMYRAFDNLGNSSIIILEIEII